MATTSTEYEPTSTYSTTLTVITSTEINAADLLTPTIIHSTFVTLSTSWAPFTTITSTFGASGAAVSSSVPPPGPNSSTNSTTTDIATVITSPVSGFNTTTPTLPVSTVSHTNGTAPTNPATTRKVVSKGVSTGTAVGIGFGTAIAGAFIALLAGWFLLRRSRRSLPAGEKSWISDESRMRGFGGAKENRMGKGVSPSIVALEDIPLDPADDSQIRKSLQSLSELIHQHVENHYSARNFQGRREDLKRELTKCGWSDRTEPSAQTLESLLINPVTRRVAIRHIIAWVIIQHADLKSSPDVSLLPAHIVASGQAMLKIKRTQGEKEVFSNLFTKWRYLTASLLSPLSSRSENLESDSNLRPAVTRNVNLLNGILQPFIKSGTEAQLAQSENLGSIILVGAHFGILLFSQPVIWMFGWDGKNLKQGGRNDQRSGTGNGNANKFLVVFPSIGKLITRDGSETLRTVVDPVLEHL